MPQVSVAGPQDRPAVVETFVSAFASDPAMRFFLPDDDEYQRTAPVLAGHLFDRRVDRGSVWIADQGLSVSMWDRPDAEPSEGPPLDLSADVQSRWDAYNDAVHARLPTERHWYLGVLATHRRAAGRRLGRAVLGAGLAMAGEAGLPAVLETSTQANVDLYGRSGFEVVAAFSVADLPVWVMRHPAPVPG